MIKENQKVIIISRVNAATDNLTNTEVKTNVPDKILSVAFGINNINSDKNYNENIVESINEKVIIK